MSVIDDHQKIKRLFERPSLMRDAISPFGSVIHSCINLFYDTRDTSKYNNLSILYAETTLNNDPHKNHVSRVEYVKSNNKFSSFDEEEKLINTRNTKVRETIRNFFGRKSTENICFPKIALCCSGGGMRACISTFGALGGLQEMGILDAISYMVGLSGSTWAIAKYVTSKFETWQERRQEMRTFATIGIDPITNYGNLQKDYEKFIGRHFAENITEPTTTMTILDMWSKLITDGLFYNNPDGKYTLTMSGLRNYLSDGSLPYPIFTAIKPVMNSETSNFDWYEITPNTVGKITGTGSRRCYIPTWGFGRQYAIVPDAASDAPISIESIKVDLDETCIGAQMKDRFDVNIDSQSFGIEPYLGKILGVCGSAFAVNVGKMRQASEQMYSSLESIAENYLGFKNFFHLSPVSGMITYNFDKKQSTNDVIELKDAGIHFNLPLPAIFNPERKIDITIVWDCSGNLNDSPGIELIEFVRYAKLQNIDIPSSLSRLEVFDVNEYPEKIAVFKAEKPGQISVIYVPTLRVPNIGNIDPMDFSTFKFSYSEKEFNDLMGYSVTRIYLAAQIIEETIVEWCNLNRTVRLADNMIA